LNSKEKPKVQEFKFYVKTKGKFCDFTPSLEKFCD